jgi:anaerobic selenocysteine-containing dehydrogenase
MRVRHLAAKLFEPCRAGQNHIRKTARRFVHEQIITDDEFHSIEAGSHLLGIGKRAQFHSFYDQGQALPTLRARNRVPELWISQADAEARDLMNGDAIRIYNGRGSFEAWAHVTVKIPAGVVWMRDGWMGLNNLTSGAAVLPEAALDVFPFTVGQAKFEAMVEVSPK